MGTLKFITLPLFVVWATLVTFLVTINLIVFWTRGGKIDVRESGEVTGYLRWFKFYPKFDK